MRHIIKSLLLISILTITSYGQRLQFVRPGYSVNLSGGATPDPVRLPLVVGRLDTLSPEDQDRRFGILYRGLGREAMSFRAMELTDVSTGRNVLSLSALEITGTFSPTIERIADLSIANDSVKADAFRIERDGSTFTLIQTQKRVRSASLPKGSALMIEWAIISDAALSVRPVFRGIIEGPARVAGNAVIIEPDAVASGYTPSLVISSEPSSSLSISETPISPVRTATFEGTDIALQAGVRAPFFSLRVTSTTVAIPQYADEQASILAAHLSGTAAAPRMITMTTVNKETVQSGDTLEYNILFHNIGTAPAVDVVLRNPISEGLRYLAGSATTEMATMTFDRTAPEPPQAPVVRAITWTFTSNILPGEERWVSFKTIVQ